MSGRHERSAASRKGSIGVALRTEKEEEDDEAKKKKKREKKWKGKKNEKCNKLRNIIGLSYGRGCVVRV